ncbi:MAG: circadian clock protein KaiC [Thiohalocapsa sp.]|nr:circadian clock protein KaiC [Thiohalocapsa sp.]MCF7990355.1 circadian clock protein KaiC [Thiohalocapsa sp.]
MSDMRSSGIEKLPSGIQGLDVIADGGFPRGRTTLVAGSAGSGKTTLAAQFLVEGLRRYGEPGVFVCFQESADDIRRNFASLGWPVGEWEAASLWAFVDASPTLDEPVVESGSYDLGALIARVETTVRRIGAKRAAVDSLGAVFHRFSRYDVIRAELARLTLALGRLGVTTVMTAGRDDEYGRISRHGVEEIVSDNIIVLRNALEGERRRRTLEVLKFSGTSHRKGEYPFSVMPDAGIAIVPVSDIQLRQHASTTRVGSGNSSLDAMCGGGFFRGSIVLVSGATGCGKTVMATEFVGCGAEHGERSLLFAFEESSEQLARNAAGHGLDFDAEQRSGRLRVIAACPEARSLDDHLIAIEAAIDEFRPRRVAVDSFSALERGSTAKLFRDFVLGLAAIVRERHITALFTVTDEQGTGATCAISAQIASMTDCIIVLRHIETLGQMTRAITVLKMRGSAHDKTIRELTVDGSGLHVGAALHGLSGIVAAADGRAGNAVVERAASEEAQASLQD